VGYEPEELFSLIEGRKLVTRYWDGRVKILDNQSGVSDMGVNKIKDVTDFMRNDVEEMNKQAEELHGVAQNVKEQFKTIMGTAREQLDQAQKDLMELQAAMGGTSNFPPPETGSA
jgi:DNA phosphorothioation-dependent restriction protein DptG